MKSMWDERYAGPDYFYGTEANEFLRMQAGLITAGGHVLCLAEGEGRNAVFLAESGLAVTAVDFAETGRRKALALANSRDVSIDYRLADLAEFDFGMQSWDAVISVFCHLPETLRRHVHRHVIQGLKPNGLFIIEAYTPRQLNFGTGGPQSEALMYDAGILEGDFPGEWLLLRETERDVREGLGHHGHSAVVQGAWRKPGMSYADPLHKTAV